MKIQIIQKQCGGTEFLAQPHRLHLGAQNAAGVDELLFQLPDAWAGCTLALYLRRSDGTLLAPVALDTQHRVTVDRRLTGSTGGQWMLAAMGENGYTSSSWPACWKAPAAPPRRHSVPQPVQLPPRPTQRRPRPPHSAPAPTAPTHPSALPVQRPLPPAPKSLCPRTGRWSASTAKAAS